MKVTDFDSTGKGDTKSFSLDAPAPGTEAVEVGVQGTAYLKVTCGMPRPLQGFGFEPDVGNVGDVIEAASAFKNDVRPQRALRLTGVHGAFSLLVAHFYALFWSRMSPFEELASILWKGAARRGTKEPSGPRTLGRIQSERRFAVSEMNRSVIGRKANRLVVAILGIVVVSLVGTGSLAAPMAGESADGFIEVSRAVHWDPAGEARLLAQVNEARHREGRAPLTVDPRLSELARQKAADMALNAYFDHVSPTLGTVYDMLRGAGIDYKWAGENIARLGTVAIAHQSFMESPDHRANILSAGYTRVGIGVAEYRGKVYVCQIFTRPRT